MHKVKMFYSYNEPDILFFIMPVCMCYKIYFHEMNEKKRTVEIKTEVKAKINYLYVISFYSISASLIKNTKYPWHCNN